MSRGRRNRRQSPRTKSTDGEKAQFFIPADDAVRGAWRRAAPWLRSYPPGLDWDAQFRPSLVNTLLDEAVQAYGPRPCTYFMGKRLSFAEIGELSDRAAKGLRAIGVGEGVKVGLLLPNTPTFVIFYYGVLKAGGHRRQFQPALQSRGDRVHRFATAAPRSW